MIVARRSCAATGVPARFEPEELPSRSSSGLRARPVGEAAAIRAEYGYDEINLNVGCPSDRVQQATFGACLMARPKLVADCVRAMQGAVNIPVTVKCRIGIDDRDDWPFLAIHRCGKRSGLPCRNRPRAQGDPEGAHAEGKSGSASARLREGLARERRVPGTYGLANGGLRTVPQVTEQLAHVDGVMLGREAYHNPYLLPALHRAVNDDGFETPPVEQIVLRMRQYSERQVAAGTPLRSITRHMLGLFNGRAGARAWRRALSEGVNRSNPSPALIEDALRAATACA